MIKINHSILGSGLSALVRDKVKINSKIFYCNEKKIIKSKKFYEFNGFGGNTNIWGGYVNYERYKNLIKNSKFQKFKKKNNFFKIRKYMNSFINITHYLSNKNNNDILRIKKSNFKNELINEKITKIKVQKKNIYIIGKKIYKTKTLDLCVGNLGILKLLYNSKLVNKGDIISFEDGSCSYSLNIFLNKKKYYYIPMKLGDVIKKIFYKKIKKYNENCENGFLVQKFSYNKKKFNYRIEDIMKYESRNIRYFLSNHIVKLSINKMPIKIFIKKISKNINVYNSGVLRKYIAGPISQDIIYNSFDK